MRPSPSRKKKRSQGSLQHFVGTPIFWCMESPVASHSNSNALDNQITSGGPRQASDVDRALPTSYLKDYQSERIALY